MNFLQYLQQRVQQKDMSFADFMQEVLYSPYGGYYNSRTEKWGNSGDYVTAPELTSLFGRTVANQLGDILQLFPLGNILEFGAGSGSLCIDLLQQLELLEALPAQYFILEVSGTLAQRQRALIQQKIPHLISRIHWLQQWPEQSFNGVIIANEVLDAMPVHRFLQTENGLLESYITLDEKKQFQEVFKAETNPRLIEHLSPYLPRQQIPYISEANLFIDDWLKNCFACLDAGMVLLIDYGFPAHEYYHPDRHLGTLMCHYRHQAHSNPLINLGEQDITAHVNFTHVAHAGLEAGFQVAGYTNQASFLLSCGLLSLLENVNPEREKIKMTQAVKKLIQPQEMGELFKVIALNKNLKNNSLRGFQLHDKRGSL